MKCLFKGNVVQFDKDTLKWFDWNYICISKHGYLIYSKNNRYYPIHQMILGKAPKGLVIDHINRDKLDNRRKNLRFVTTAENNKNSDFRDKQMENKVLRLFGL